MDISWRPWDFIFVVHHRFGNKYKTPLANATNNFWFRRDPGFNGCNDVVSDSVWNDNMVGDWYNHDFTFVRNVQYVRRLAITNRP